MNNQVKVIKAARRLVKKMDKIHNSKEYKGVWTFLYSHGLTYHGKVYNKEFESLRKALDEL